MSVRLYTNDEMARDFQSYRRKIKAVIALEKIPTFLVGKRECVDRDGYERVREGLARFDSRPCLARALQEAQSA